MTRVLALAVLLAAGGLTGCKPVVPDCPSYYVPQWQDDPASADPDAGTWLCVDPRTEGPS